MTSVALVGNDVVDLRDPAIAGHHRRTRFVARVCTTQEVARVEASLDPHRTLWSLFAAKEAGFKVVAKLTPGIAFSPRRFVVDAQLSSVAHDVARLWLRVTHGEDWVHAIAGQGDGEPLWAVERRARQVGESWPPGSPPTIWVWIGKDWPWNAVRTAVSATDWGRRVCCSTGRHSTWT